MCLEAGSLETDSVPMHPLFLPINLKKLSTAEVITHSRTSTGVEIDRVLQGFHSSIFEYPVLDLNGSVITEPLEEFPVTGWEAKLHRVWKDATPP